MTIRLLTRDQSGATVVEFALVLIPLCIVLMGALDIGYQSYMRATLQGSLNDVARIASVEHPDLGTEGDTLQEQVENAIKEKMKPLARSGTYTITARSYSEFSGIGKPEPLVTDKNGNGRYDPGDCWQDANPNGTFDLDAGQSGTGGASDVVFYEVNLNVPHILPLDKFIGLADHHEVNAKIAIRNQPYGDQAQPKVRCS
jgi:Flp pilus assembly pilin Flp